MQRPITKVICRNANEKHQAVYKAKVEEPLFLDDVMAHAKEGMLLEKWYIEITKVFNDMRLVSGADSGNGCIAFYLEEKVKRFIRRLVVVQSGMACAIDKYAVILTDAAFHMQAPSLRLWQVPEFKEGGKQLLTRKLRRLQRIDPRAIDRTTNALGPEWTDKRVEIAKLDESTLAKLWGIVGDELI
jgi:hypothetical protein